MPIPCTEKRTQLQTRLTKAAPWTVMDIGSLCVLGFIGADVRRRKERGDWQGKRKKKRGEKRKHTSDKDMQRHNLENTTKEQLTRRLLASPCGALRSPIDCQGTEEYRDTKDAPHAWGGIYWSKVRLFRVLFERIRIRRQSRRQKGH